MYQWILKTSMGLLLTLSLVSPGGVNAQSQVNGNLNITTDATVGKIKNNGGKTYLSSVNLSGSSIQSGGLNVTATSTANTVTAEEGSQVSVASLLMNDSAVGSVSKPITMEAHVQDVTADQNARVDISSISMNGSTISGNLTVDDKIFTQAGNITVGENGSAAVASLLMNDSSANNVTIGKMSAVIENLNVEDNATARISSLEMTGVHAGDVTFSADTRLGGTVTASAGGNLNVNSVVMEGLNVSGLMNFDLSSDVKGGIEVSGEESVVMIGSVRVDETSNRDASSLNPNAIPDQKVYSPELLNAYLSMCVYNDPRDKELCDKVMETTGIRPEGKPIIDNVTGFKAQLYYNPATDSYILAFAGTNTTLKEGALDVIFGDVPQIIGISDQYEEAMLLAEKAANYAKMNGKDIGFTGHSMGGGLAAAASLLTGKKATTFNAAWLSPLTIYNHLIVKYMSEIVAHPKEIKAKRQLLDSFMEAYKKNETRQEELITAYTVKGELLFGDEQGRKVRLDTIEEGGPIHNHGIHTVIAILEGQKSDSYLAGNGSLKY
jgi:hypothetical protein